MFVPFYFYKTDDCIDTIKKPEGASSSHLGKEMKTSEELETENKVLLSPIVKIRKISQDVSGNLCILYLIKLYPSYTLLLIHNMNSKE